MANPLPTRNRPKRNTKPQVIPTPPARLPVNAGPHYSTYREDGTYRTAPDVIRGRRPFVKEPRPLPKFAQDIYAKYLKYLAVWHLCHFRGGPVEFAASTLLCVSKSRGHEIYNELVEYGGPSNWLRDQVMDGMDADKIPRGHEIKASPLANAFFTDLVRDDEEGHLFYHAWEQVCAYPSADLSEYTRNLSDWQEEALYYKAYSGFAWRKANR